jgi:predicted DCC family thiol-disulfide oxidoreductase YuxK
MADRPLLFYAGACPLCRLLSRGVVLLSLGAIRRVPLDRAAAEDFFLRDHPQARGKPVLVHGGRVAAGAAVLAAIPRAIAAAWFGRRTDNIEKETAA